VLGGCTPPAGAAAEASDCDDLRADVNPAAGERCDGAVDEDCDGRVDDADPTVDLATARAWFADVDGDGAGDPNVTVLACAAPAGTAPAGDDCDDRRADVSPTAEERCDGEVDEDCDGRVDDADDTVVDADAAYADADGDGFGAALLGFRCAIGAGEARVAGDCDDARADVSPGGVETCADPADEDCDTLVDAADPDAVGATWYQDVDGDGAAGPDVSVASCASPGADWRATARDCDDANPQIRPGALEVCSGIDEDCDGLIDDADPNLAGGSVWFVDADGDGFGSQAAAAAFCDPPGDGWAVVSFDCDDADPAISPRATEVCDPDDRDEDCDGRIDNDQSPAPANAVLFHVDADRDDHGDPFVTALACDPEPGLTAPEDADDCDDANARAYPGAQEVCDPADADEDCDGLVDDADPSFSPASTPDGWSDFDNDGFGGQPRVVFTCALPAGVVGVRGDCDDADPSINPGAVERCDPGNVDEDCDGLADDEDLTVDRNTRSVWFLDSDADGWGGDQSVVACDASAGRVATTGDCEPFDPTVFPGALDVPGDGVDQDCDGIDAALPPVDTADSAVEDTDVAETDVADSDPVDTDPADTDVADTDPLGETDTDDGPNLSEKEGEDAGGCCSSGPPTLPRAALVAALLAFAARRRVTPR
jgi:hypothetical protein